ncbi:MAG: hypothetical protein DMD26_09450 [Gemmatimonadetes bacterium]|nr:MAG: hypothetical protein DMD26_09450 [Gemmatimonadota bacterium]
MSLPLPLSLPLSLPLPWSSCFGWPCCCGCGFDWLGIDDGGVVAGGWVVGLSRPPLPYPFPLPRGSAFPGSPWARRPLSSCSLSFPRGSWGGVCGG